MSIAVVEGSGYNDDVYALNGAINDPVAKKNIDVEDDYPLSQTFTEWAGDKGKYFLELMERISFLFGNIDFLGRGASQWKELEKGMKYSKGFLALPSAIKGTVNLCQDYTQFKDGGLYLRADKLVRNMLGDMCTIFCDALDGIRSLYVFSFNNGKIIEEKLPFKHLDNLKSVLGIAGLSNLVWNISTDIAKLRTVDLTKAPKGVSEPEKAIEIKKRWVEAEINSKWWDAQRHISAIASCTLSLGIAAAATCFGVTLLGATASMWTFAIIGMTGTAGKFLTYKEKEEAARYQKKLAELMPAVKA